jgi:hypothetical protein
MLPYPGTAKCMGLHFSEKFVYCLNRSGEIHEINNEIEIKIAAADGDFSDNSNA